MQVKNITLKNGFQSYPEYKDSGIEWIGKIPKDWDVARAKTLFKKMNRQPLDSDEIITAFRDGTVTLRVNRREDGFTMADKEIGYQRILRGDLVIHAMDAFAGAVGVSDSDGKASPVYSACVPMSDRSIPEYYAYLLRHMSKSEYIFALSKGIRERSTDFRFKEFGNLFVVEPAQSEQKKITAYLDEKTALIDRIIEKKRRLAELLRERRTAIINQTVTRGLDPNAELVDSGIEWIGKIPKGWEVKKLKYVANVQASNVDKLTDPSLPQVLLCNYVDVYKHEYIDGRLNFMPSTATPEQMRKVGLKKGDVLFTKDSETADDIGVPAFVKESVPNLVSGYHLYLARPKNDQAGEFIFRYLQSKFVRVQFELSANGVTRFGLGSMAVKDLPTLVPPFKEQQSIVDHIKGKMDVIDRALMAIENSIESLKEFKSSLISNVVTGKVRV